MPKKKMSATPDPSPAPARPATRRRSTTFSPRSTATSRERLEPTYHEIAEAAYRRFLNRGAAHGRDFEDWLEAERELRDRPDSH